MIKNNQKEVFKGGWEELQHANNINSTPSAIANARGLDFKPDGTKMYTINTATDEIVDYDLSTPWDSTTISKNGDVFNVLFLGGAEMCVQWTYDGLTCYYSTAGPNTIYQLDATTPFDSSTLSFNSVSFSPTEETADIQCVFVLPDEQKFYVLFANLTTLGRIYEYDMPTKGDLANSVFSGNSIDINALLSANLRVFSVDPGGLRCYIYERNVSNIHRLTFRIIKDISSLVLEDDLSTSAEEGLVIGMYIRPTDGKKLYFTGILQDNIDEFDMSLITNNSIITTLGEELTTEAGENIVSV